MLKKLVILIALATSIAAHAATLRLHVSHFNQANGDRLQYKLPGGSWMTVDPAYGLYIVYGVPNNYIVSARVYNSGRTISLQVKATWFGNGGDADRSGNVDFWLYGTG